MTTRDKIRSSEATREAFFSICQNAQEPQRSYVSLYASQPFYGGPEEGGWWGSDQELIASDLCHSEEEANAKLAKIKELAKQLHAESRKEFGLQCLREMEWLDSRGLDADYLPEPDGETTYFATIEQQRGSQERRGNRHYE